MSVYQDLHRSKYESVLKELKESFDKKQNFKDHILEYVQFNNDFSQPYAGVSNFNKTLQQLETANLDVQSGMKSAIERIDGTYQEFLDPFIQLPRLDVEVNALIAQINTHKHLFLRGVYNIGARIIWKTLSVMR